MARELPASIAHYTIISAIGAGGMGEVYLAQDSKLERQVALKVLLDEVAGNEERVRRFVQEAKAASALNHPNILTVYEIGEFEHTRYIATELIKGETLRDRLRGEPMTLREVLDVAMQVAAALNAAHSAGIVHRDIKPENIMLRDDGIVKVLDFGLAKLTAAQTGSADPEDATRAQVNTRPGVVMGTVLYMSPEQARGKETDARSDVWSLGVVMFEMLAGSTPFVGETSNDSIAAILTKEPPPLADDTPSELRRIVRKSLQKQTDERYQTVKDLLLDVKNLKKELEFSEELERSSVPQSTGSSNVSTVQRSENATAIHTGVISTQNSIPQQMSSAEYLVTQVKRGKYWILPLAVLLIAGIGLGVYKYSGNPAIKISLDSAKVTRLTNSGKVGDFVAISPDGKWLVYTVVEGEQQSLWLKQVAIPDSNTQIAPPSETIYGGMSFSPDGNYLYYTESSIGWLNGSLFQVPVLGGTAKKVLDGIWGKASFSPDGKQVAYISYVDDEDRLTIANADGTEQRVIAVRKGNEAFVDGLQGPAWSPDGKIIATTISTIDPQFSMSLAAITISTGEISLFSSQKFNWTGDVNWLTDGSSLLIHAREAATQSNSLWQISYPSGEAKKITNDLNNRLSISLTAESNALATVQIDLNSHVWVAPIADSGRAKQVTSGSDLNAGATWTPSDKIVFSRLSAGGSDLFMVDPNGGSPRQLTANAGLNSSPEVSPDERFIVFGSDRGGISTIWRTDIDGGNPRQLVTSSSNSASFSPDGREVIYLRSLNKQTIWKVSIEGGEPFQLTDKQSTSPRFSPDGKQFVCLLFDDAKSGPKIAIFPSSGGSPIKTFSVPKTIERTLRWTPDGQSIVYADSKGGVGNIWTQPLDGGKPKQLTSFTSERILDFDISSDGKQLALSRGTRTSDVVLISGIKK